MGLSVYMHRILMRQVNNVFVVPIHSTCSVVYVTLSLDGDGLAKEPKKRSKYH